MARPDPPLIAGRIHGVRVWTIGLTDGTAELRGHGDEPWAPDGKPTVARCLSGGRRRRRRVAHRPPIADCSCGLYALHPHAGRQGMYGFSRVAHKRAGDAFPEEVAGIVEAWGRIELHEDGFRAQFARPHTLALIGPSRDSDVGSVIVRLARRYGAEVVEVESTEELAEYCRERSLGLDPATVRSLVPDDPPADDSGAGGDGRPAGARFAVAACPRREARHDRHGRRRRCSGTGRSAPSASLIAVGVIRAIVEPSPVEFPSHHLRIVDQALVEMGGRLRYVAVVRNTSQKRVALAAFPDGSVLDQSGKRIVRLGDRARIEARPSLPPGATGLIVDVLPPRPHGRPAGASCVTRSTSGLGGLRRARAPLRRCA